MSAESETVDSAVQAYSAVMLALLDKHAPMKTIQLKGQTKKPWYNDTIHAARQKRRRLESQWKRTGLVVHREMFVEQSKLVGAMICRAKRVYFHDKLEKCDNKNMFRVVNGLLCTSDGALLPAHEDKTLLANKFADFFEDKIKKIRQGFPPPCDLEVGIPDRSLTSFRPVTQGEMHKLIMSRPSKSCALDPIPTFLLKDPLILPAAMPLIVKCVNESIESGTVPESLKSSLVTPLLKKPTLDRDVLKNYRPVSNLPFIGKVIEKVIASQLVHFLNTN